MPRVVAQALTREAFSPFGHVLQAAPPGEAGRLMNQGSARRFDWQVPIENLRGERAPLNVFAARCAPRSLPLAVALLERHRYSTQLFVPMNARRYLVVVALGGDQPDLWTLQAFVASGGQGVAYRPGVWHHPSVALEAETDFACLVHEDGSESDCEERPLPDGGGTVVEVGQESAS